MNFLIAALHAGKYYCARSLGECRHRAAGFLRSLWALWFSPRIDERTYVYRLITCRMCPLYHPERETCGFPENDEPKTCYQDGDEMKPMGCFCHMPTKAKLRDADCWLNENYPDGAPIHFQGWHPNPKRS